MSISESSRINDVDASVTILSIIASALTAIIISVIGVMASRKKDDAAANAITSGEWKRLYDEMCRRIEKQDVKIEKMGNELDLYKDTVQYLWLGILALTRQLEKEGVVPEFTPELNFRGDDDFDEDDWKWLNE